MVRHCIVPLRSTLALHQDLHREIGLILLVLATCWTVCRNNILFHEYRPSVLEAWYMERNPVRAVVLEAWNMKDMVRLLLHQLWCPCLWRLWYLRKVAS